MTSKTLWLSLESSKSTLMAVLVLLLGGAMLASLALGAVTIAPSQVWQMLWQGPVSGQGEIWHSIIWQIRLPRTCLAALVGAGLAVAGACMQGLFRNPLADPGLIGVSSGAALAASVAIVLGGLWIPQWMAGAGVLALPVVAFAGGLLMTVIVYRLSSVEGRVNVATLLLAGIAVNALAGAGIGLLTYLADDAQLRSLNFWMLGSLGGATWQLLWSCMPWVILVLVCSMRFSQVLNVWALGESQAAHLGVDVQRVKWQLMLLCALIVGALVAVSGLIGFVGLVVPHIVRLLLGPDHRWLIPGAACLGACLLLLADLLARLVIAPAEMPIGIITALLGGPFFLYLLRQRRGGWV